MQRLSTLSVIPPHPRHEVQCPWHVVQDLPWLAPTQTTKPNPCQSVMVIMNQMGPGTPIYTYHLLHQWCSALYLSTRLSFFVISLGKLPSASPAPVLIPGWIRNHSSGLLNHWGLALLLHGSHLFGQLVCFSFKTGNQLRSKTASLIHSGSPGEA